MINSYDILSTTVLLILLGILCLTTVPTIPQPRAFFHLLLCSGRFCWKLFVQNFAGFFLEFEESPSCDGLRDVQRTIYYGSPSSVGLSCWEMEEVFLLFWWFEASSVLQSGVQQTNLSLWLVMTTKGPAPTATTKLPPRSGRLSSEILAKMDRRSVAAHPWHDLEIGNYSLHFSSWQGSQSSSSDVLGVVKPGDAFALQDILLALWDIFS